MTPFSFPLTWAIGPLLMLLWGGAGFWAGDYHRNNAWLAKQAVVEHQAYQAYQVEVQRGQSAALQSVAQQQALQTNFQNLEGKFNELRKRGPLVVFRTAPVAPAGAPAVASAGATAAVADAAVGLSLGAVWMWNSALAGADAPAGACAAADTAAGACAADSGLSLEDAWANQAANARACALDRLHHQQLIDFVTTGPHP
jgi:hypothetical protein